MRQPLFASFLARIGTLLISILAWLGTARAQGAPAGPLHPNPNAPPEELPTSQQQHPIRTVVSIVTAPVVVHSARTGEMVLDLTKNDFHVYDNGVEQKIDHFDLGGDPLSLVLVVETSSRVAPMLPAIRQSGIVFSSAVMGQTAEAAVLGYDDTVDLLESFTTDVDDVQKTINDLKAGTAGRRLYDAMSRGITTLEERPPVRRRILLVIGEARDTGSENRLGAVLRHAQLANVTVFAVGLSSTSAELRQSAEQSEPRPNGPPGTYPVPTPTEQPETPQMEQAAQGNMNLGALLIWLVKTGKDALGANSLEIASKATGGLDVSTLHDREIQQALDKIGGELHAEYVVGYHPAQSEPSGYHQIKVSVDRKNITVRSRPGYYIPPPVE
ncbi:MAG TPA: VWA domain-containing protein [Candidatus Cybelea sp.]|nr:VWA domain-containing protein [Candidatus Cybelea sp.]